MTGLPAKTIEKTLQQMIPLPIFQRIAEKDQTAVKDCIKTYGNFIWALARKFTASREEAEAATLEIFNDIWRYAERSSDKPPTHEEVLIALVARKRLIKYLQQ